MRTKTDIFATFVRISIPYCVVIRRYDLFLSLVENAIGYTYPNLKREK